MKIMIRPTSARRLVVALVVLGSLLLSVAASAARGRPQLDTSLGYNVLVTDQGTLLRGVSLSFDGGDPWGSLPVNLPSQASLDALATDYGLNAVHVFLEGDAAQNPDPVGVNLDVADQLVQRTANAGLYLIITIGAIASVVGFGSHLSRPLFRFVASAGLREMLTAVALFMKCLTKALRSAL